MQLPSDGGGPRRDHARAMIDMTMSPDGPTVTHAERDRERRGGSAGAGRARRPRRSRRRRWSPRARAGAGLQTATFEGAVDYRETRAARGAAPAVDRHATARRLIVHTKPGFGDIQQAEFHGNVRFVDGTRTTAEAPIGLYQVEQDRLDLSPSASDPGPPPTVTGRPAERRTRAPSR